MRERWDVPNSGRLCTIRAGAARARSIRSMRTTQEIVQSIDIRLRELSEEIKSLDAARSALEDRKTRTPRRAAQALTEQRRPATGARSSAQARAQASRQASAKVARASASRSRSHARTGSRLRGRGAPDGTPADRLESLLSESGGLTTAALADRANANRDQVLRLLRELETAGRIRRTGQRRATRWHAITDEERIRERAAELEATRKRPA